MTLISWHILRTHSCKIKRFWKPKGNAIMIWRDNFTKSKRKESEILQHFKSVFTTILRNRSMNFATRLKVTLREIYLKLKETFNYKITCLKTMLNSKMMKLAIMRTLQKNLIARIFNTKKILEWRIKLLKNSLENNMNNQTRLECLGERLSYLKNALAKSFQTLKKKKNC
jgi:hypothetical protein